MTLSMRRPTPTDLPFTREVPSLAVVSSHVAAAAGRVVELRHERLLVGREASADISLSDQRLSRRHAELRAEAGGILLVDLSSTNGTWVNGVRCVKQRLRHGDSVRLGSTVFRFVDTSDERADEVARASACVHGNLTRLQQSFSDGSLTLEELDELVRDCQQSVERLADKAREGLRAPVDDITPAVTRNVGGRS